ncbi:MAG: cobalamin biosynthesis protein, partial [Pseudomonadota bacterium]
MPAAKPAVIWFVAAAEETAQRSAKALGADLIGPEDMDSVAETTRALFAARRPIVGVCAAGILIRALAPLISSKQAEPPVIAVSPGGGSVVPLLGGHHGANDMARALADALQGAPAITTAGDMAFGVALDEPPEGWVLENPEDAKTVMAALLSGAKATLSGEAPWLAKLGAAPETAPGAVSTARLTVGGAALLYHRRTLSLGVGCARGCPPEEMANLVREALETAGRHPLQVASIHSIDLKADEAAIAALGDELGITPRYYPAETLEAQTPR